LYLAAGTEVRRIVYTRSTGSGSDMMNGMITEWLTAGTAYNIRYFSENAGSTILALNALTYCRIRAVPL
jgi:uncharacterized protein (UPF0276 family)